MTYGIQIICLSATVWCQEPPDTSTYFYTTLRACNNAVIQVARQWRPLIGDYAFHCQKESAK